MLKHTDKEPFFSLCKLGIGLSPKHCELIWSDMVKIGMAEPEPREPGYYPVMWWDGCPLTVARWDSGGYWIVTVFDAEPPDGVTIGGALEFLKTSEHIATQANGFPKDPYWVGDRIKPRE